MNYQHALHKQLQAPFPHLIFSPDGSIPGFNKLLKLSAEFNNVLNACSTLGRVRSLSSALSRSVQIRMGLRRVLLTGTLDERLFSVAVVIARAVACSGIYSYRDTTHHASPTAAHIVFQNIYRQFLIDFINLFHINRIYHSRRFTEKTHTTKRD